MLCNLEHSRRDRHRLRATGSVESRPKGRLFVVRVRAWES
jgi:hypothetical protein